MFLSSLRLATSETSAPGVRLTGAVKHALGSVFEGETQRPPRPWCKESGGPVAGGGLDGFSFVSGKLRW